MKRYIIVILSIVLTLGCYAQRKNNNVSKQTTQQTTTKKSKSASLSKATGTIAGHGYVDLGLPSGLKWATCNVGADRPEGYGGYFSWGETTPQNVYNVDEYVPLTVKDNQSYIDYYGNLSMSHDAAHANWGATWRIPTEDEINELIEYTTTRWTSFNGVKGLLVVSIINGKSIFLPATGALTRHGLTRVGDNGHFFSSKSYEYEGCFIASFSLSFSRSDFEGLCLVPAVRQLCLTIRPVSE